MKYSRLMVSAAVISFLLLPAVQPLYSQEINTDNVQDYLESGELSYTIEINFSRIKWKDADAYNREIEKAEEVLNREPDNPAEITAYITTCRDAGRHELAADAAAEYYPVLQDDYKRRGDEISARRLLIAANQTGSRDIQISAYETVRPFLELGDADIETVYVALNNRERLEDYHLGFRIAEFYQQVYPEDAELYFRGFLMTLNNSLYKTIPFMINAIHERIAEPDAFLLEYYRALKDAIYLDMLDQALNRDPENYQYLLSSVGFRAMVRWFSQLSTMMVEEETDLGSIQEVFNSLDLDQDERLRRDLEMALQNRPEPDHQIFLAAALFHVTAGNNEKAREYVNKALQTSSAAPEPYNALIFLEMLSFAGRDTPPTAAQRERIDNILLRKIGNSGATAYDLYVRSALRLLTVRDGVTLQRKKEISAEMRELALGSLAQQETLLGHLALGNSYLLQNEYERAEKEYLAALRFGPETLMYAPTANLGVTYLLQGKREAGVRKIREAQSMTETSLKAAPLLRD